MKNYGLKIDKIKPTDYIFGSALPFEEINTSGDWIEFLPYKERQDLNGIEPYACVSFTILNCLEILVKKQYGEDRNWSDRFLASISGTRVGGNSPQVVCDFLRKLGVVPQDIFPFDEKITSFEEFYSPIPQELYNIAKEFLAEFDFKYEFVPDDKEQIKKALKCSPLLLSVVAWFSKDDKYVRPEGMADNHATTLIAVKEGEYKRVFDSYADGEGDPFLKDYEWNAPHSIIMRFFIKKKEPLKDTEIVKDIKKTPNWFIEIMANLLAFLLDIIKVIFKRQIK